MTSSTQQVFRGVTQKTAANSKKNQQSRQLSKDLIAVINDNSEGDSSQYHEKVGATSQPNLNTNPAPTPDHKRGSAITFFDDSDNEGGKKLKDM